jgi:hypothetical protein
MALLPGSVAITAGFDTTQPPYNLTTDQRGSVFARKVYGQVDIGAFEYQGAASTSNVPPPTPTTLYVLDLYRTVLGRAADVDGMACWVQRLQSGASRQLVAQGIWESAEHRGLEVDQDYATYLHRAADAGGRAFWLQQLQSGKTEADVALGFVTSAEYCLAHPSAGAFVLALYTDLQGRTADAGGLAFWMNLAQTPRGAAPVVGGILNSAEYAQRTLDRYYAAFLGRTPDLTGDQSWLFALVNHRGTPSSVAESFLASDEFFARTGGTN